MSFFDHASPLFSLRKLAPVWLGVSPCGDLTPDFMNMIVHVLSKNEVNPHGLNRSIVEKMIQNGTYPNYFHMGLMPDEEGGGSEILIDQVRILKTFLTMTPSIPGWRVAYITDADRMNRNAANAVLKFLEEPPRETLILMTCRSKGAILPTIRSRCQIYEAPYHDQNRDEHWDDIAAQFVRDSLASIKTQNVEMALNKRNDYLTQFETALLGVIADKIKSLKEKKHQVRLSKIWETLNTFIIMSDKTHLDINHRIHSYYLMINNK